MKEQEEKKIDIDYIIKRDKIIKLLMDDDLYYSFYDVKRINQILNLLYKYLKKGAK